MKPSTPVCGKRILLVDDEPLVRNATRMLLEVDQHKVVEAGDGAEAFELFDQSQFDLVITDFRMPFVNGSELTDKIKGMAPGTPVIMITAWPGDVQPSKTPPDLVISKPYSFQDLRKATAEVLR